MIVGLTGSIGSGKSTALALFESLGWRTIDCDKIVADLLEQPEVQSHIIAHFGHTIETSIKKLDKKKLANIVFNNSKQLNWLENYLHPLVHQRWQSKVREDYQSKWIIEVPLLFEKKLEDHFEFTVCILSSHETQYRRLENRGLSAEEIKLRLKQQFPSSEKAQQADFVLVNDGTLSFLKKQIESVIKKMVSLDKTY